MATRTSRTKLISTASEFRKAIHSQKNIRDGLIAARRRIPPELTHEFVQEIISIPVYRVALAVSPFPTTYSLIRPKRPMGRISPEVDFIWNSAVLQFYSVEINSFLRKKRDFDVAFLTAHYDDADKILADIKNELGVSLFYVDARLRLLQKFKGIAAQKAFLEEVINSPTISIVVAWLAYFFSYSCEETSTLSDLYREFRTLSNSMDQGTDITDYFQFQANPFDFSRVNAPYACIVLNESMPIVDRYLTFVSMLQLEVIRSTSSAPWYIVRAVETLKDIEDERLNSLKALFAGSQSVITMFTGALFGIHDAYSSGDYDRCVATSETLILKNPADPSLYELYTRAHAYRGTQPSAFSADTLLTQVFNSIRRIILFELDSTSARTELEKCVLMLRNTSAASFLAALIYRNHAFTLVDEYTEFDALGALQSNLENPWHLDLFERLFDLPDLLRLSADRFANNTSVKLQLMFRKADNPDFDTIRTLHLPPEREKIYLGHMAMHLGEYSKAITLYSSVSNSPLRITYLTANAHLFRAYVKNGNVNHALRLIINTYFVNERTFDLYNPRDLIQRAIHEGIIRGDILALPIAAGIYSLRSGREFDSDLSDIFEYALEALGVDRPSVLRNRLSEFDHNDIVFFFRHVSVIRYLEDLTVFDTYADVELERISILQVLIEHDPASSALYSDEIKAISRDMAVAALLRRVDESRIFVDEEGLKRTLDILVRDRFLKFREIVSSPQLEYQTAEIVRRFKQLAKDAEPELRNLRLPASERESLFHSIYADCLTEFVLNPAYGLDTYISTRVRHGAIEGELRSALSKRGLIFPVTAQPRTIENIWAAWSEVFDRLDGASTKCVVDSIVRFSERANERIKRVQAQILRIQGIEYPDGKFEYSTPPDEMNALLNVALTATTFDQFVSVLFEHYWKLVRRCLNNIKVYLTVEFKEAMTAAFMTLISSLEKCCDRRDIAELMDAIAHGRTEFLASLDRVTNWFNRSQATVTEPFRFDIAVQVALRIIANCFPKITVAPTQSIRLRPNLRANVLEPIVDVLFNLLFNAIEHSGITDRCPDIRISCSEKHGIVRLRVENELGADKDLITLKDLVEKFNATIIDAGVRDERGSGIKKIKRILQYDISPNTEVKFAITEANAFLASVLIPIEVIRAC